MTCANFHFIDLIFKYILSSIGSSAFSWQLQIDWRWRKSVIFKTSWRLNEHPHTLEIWAKAMKWMWIKHSVYSSLTGLSNFFGQLIWITRLVVSEKDYKLSKLHFLNYYLRFFTFAHSYSDSWLLWNVFARVYSYVRTHLKGDGQQRWIESQKLIQVSFVFLFSTFLEEIVLNSLFSNLPTHTHTVWWSISGRWRKICARA